MTKRKTPKEIIENVKNPHLESVYIKYPGEGLREIGLKRDIGTVDESEYELYKAVYDYTERKEGIGGNRYKHTEIHTHPGYRDRLLPSALPSSADIERFLSKYWVKAMVIAQTDNKTGELKGYFVLRKKPSNPRNTISHFHYLSEEEEQGIGEYNSILNENFKNKFKNSNMKAVLKKFADTHGLQYRWVPAEGYELSDENKGGIWAFIKKEGKEGNLEKSVATISIIGFISGLFFLSLNVTGNVISNFSQDSNSLWGAILFLIGVLSGFLYIKIKKL